MDYGRGYYRNGEKCLQNLFIFINSIPGRHFLAFQFLMKYFVSGIDVLLFLMTAFFTLCKAIKIQWHDKHPTVIPRKCMRRKKKSK